MKRGAFKDLVLAHTAEVLEIAEAEQLADAITAQPVVIYESADERNRALDNAREADVEVAKQLALERRGETRRHPFSSVPDALRRWDAQRTDGACIRGAAWDGNGGGRSTTPDGDAAQREAATVAPVARCWADLFPDGWPFTESVGLTPTQARMVAEWAALGLVGGVTAMQRFVPQAGDGKRQMASKARSMVRGSPVEGGRFLQGRLPEHGEIAVYASGLFGVEVDAATVGDVASAAMADLYRMMRDCGLVPRSRKWDQMSAQRFDLRGWKSIADHLGVHVNTAQRWHREHEMPVHERFGSVVAKSAELTAWETANTAKKAVG